MTKSIADEYVYEFGVDQLFDFFGGRETSAMDYLNKQGEVAATGVSVVKSDEQVITEPTESGDRKTRSVRLVFQASDVSDPQLRGSFKEGSQVWKVREIIARNDVMVDVECVAIRPHELTRSGLRRG